VETSLLVTTLMNLLGLWGTKEARKYADRAIKLQKIIDRSLDNDDPFDIDGIEYVASVRELRNLVKVVNSTFAQTVSKD